MRYYMESIYIQIKVRGQVSPELALEEMKERRMTICLFFTQLVQTCRIVFMNVLGLIDRYSAQDHEYES